MRNFRSARDLIAPVLGAATTSTLIQTVLEIETMKHIRDLRPLLAARVKGA